MYKRRSVDIKLVSKPQKNYTTEIKRKAVQRIREIRDIL